jgi:hypothetical protein
MSVPATKARVPAAVKMITRNVAAAFQLVERLTQLAIAHRFHRVHRRALKRDRGDAVLQHQPARTPW